MDGTRSALIVANDSWTDPPILVFGVTLVALLVVAVLEARAEPAGAAV